MNDMAKGPDRILLVVIGVIGVLVLVSLIVVFTRGEPALRDASTPEGVVQRYSMAAISGDNDSASKFLTDRVRSECDGYFSENTDNIRVTLVSTTERDSTADVRVSIETSYQSGPFGDTSYENEDVFKLDKVDGVWLVDAAPWQLLVCPKV